MNPTDTQVIAGHCRMEVYDEHHQNDDCQSLSECYCKHQACNFLQVSGCQRSDTLLCCLYIPVSSFCWWMHLLQSGPSEGVSILSQRSATRSNTHSTEMIGLVKTKKSFHVTFPANFSPKSSETEETAAPRKISLHVAI